MIKIASRSFKTFRVYALSGLGLVVLRSCAKPIATIFRCHCCTITACSGTLNQQHNGVEIKSTCFSQTGCCPVTHRMLVEKNSSPSMLDDTGGQ